MSLPVPGNTTCDIYRAGNAPPSAPDVAGVPIQLIYEFPLGQQRGERRVPSLTWTHVAIMDLAVDVRDAYTGNSSATLQDVVWIPDQNGTRFNVIFIERMDRGHASDHKRVYLDRQAPNWPTNQV